jgi:hypothetical protein
MPAPHHPGEPAALLPGLHGCVLEEDLALAGSATAVEPLAGEPITGPARRLTDRYWAGDNAVLTGPSTPIPGAATSPKDADGPR